MLSVLKTKTCLNGKFLHACRKGNIEFFSTDKAFLAQNEYYDIDMGFTTACFEEHIQIIRWFIQFKLTELNVNIPKLFLDICKEGKRETACIMIEYFFDKIKDYCLSCTDQDNLVKLLNILMTIDIYDLELMNFISKNSSQIELFDTACDSGCVNLVRRIIEKHPAFLSSIPYKTLEQICTKGSVPLLNIIHGPYSFHVRESVYFECVEKGYSAMAKYLFSNKIVIFNEYDEDDIEQPIVSQRFIENIFIKVCSGGHLEMAKELNKLYDLLHTFNIQTVPVEVFSNFDSIITNNHYEVLVWLYAEHKYFVSEMLRHDHYKTACDNGYYMIAKWLFIYFGFEKTDKKIVQELVECNCKSVVYMDEEFIGGSTYSITDSMIKNSCLTFDITFIQYIICSVHIMSQHILNVFIDALVVLSQQEFTVKGCERRNHVEQIIWKIAEHDITSYNTDVLNVCFVNACLNNNMNLANLLKDHVIMSNPNINEMFVEFCKMRKIEVVKLYMSIDKKLGKRPFLLSLLRTAIDNNAVSAFETLKTVEFDWEPSMLGKVLSYAHEKNSVKIVNLLNEMQHIVEMSKTRGIKASSMLSINTSDKGTYDRHLLEGTSGKYSVDNNDDEDSGLPSISSNSSFSSIGLGRSFSSVYSQGSFLLRNKLRASIVPLETREEDW